MNMTMATVSLIVSIGLGVAAVVAWLMGRKRDFPSHCRVMAVATFVNWLPVLVVMIPAWLGVLGVGRMDVPHTFAPAAHGVVGLLTQLLMTYTVVRMNWLKKLPPRRTFWLMRVTLAMWLMAVVGGTAIYVLWYLA
ncbi:MAG: hypothetical protein JXD18_08935 [Anaerolineae bacterium]|nr:hypothetical protein [Anaerolineae bacterium]